MVLRYNWPDKIPDEVIQKEFGQANSIKFLTRKVNSIEYWSITFGDLGWWLPVNRVFPIIGITQEMLGSVIGLQLQEAPRRFPFNLSWFGLNKKQSKIIRIDPDISSFYMNEELFQKLAKILDKSIESWDEDNTEKHPRLMFSVNPLGKVTKVA